MVALDEVSLSIINKAWLALHKSTDILILVEWLIILSDKTVLSLSTEELMADLLGFCAHELHFQKRIFILRPFILLYKEKQKILYN